MIFSNFNLLILNLWIGLCRGAAGLPRFFKDRGYEAHYIEREFSNQDSERVCPEIILYSTALGHTILVESKSGANTESEQLRRYSRVSSLDLQRKAYVPADACDSYDCTIIGLRSYSDRLKVGIEAGSYTFPLLAAEDAGLSLVLNEFSVDEVNDVFTPRLDLDWNLVPMQFVPINTESTDWEIAETVMPIVLELMNAGETRITSVQICIRMCTTWGVMGPDGQRQMTAAVDRVLDGAAHGEFSEFFAFRKGVLRIVQNPLELESPKTAQAYKTLQKAQQQMLARMRRGQLEIRF